MTLRPGPYDIPNQQTHRERADRMAHPPKSLLRWMQEAYALEAPARLHAHALEEDGDPVMNGEARAYIGFSQGVIGGKWFAAAAMANDWVRVASRCDSDGMYVTPMRAAIARTSNPNERNLLGELACNVLFPLDVTRANHIPDWCRNDVVNACLERLWRDYRDAPLPRLGQARGISDAQAVAEVQACDHRWEHQRASKLYIESGYPCFRCSRCGRWAMEPEPAAVA